MCTNKNQKSFELISINPIYLAFSVMSFHSFINLE